MTVLGSVEPWTPRESAVLGALHDYWDTDVPIIKLGLSDVQMTRLEVCSAISRIPFNHSQILRHHVVDRDTPHGVAQKRAITVTEVHDGIREALQALIRIIFADLDAGQPPYVSGPRIRRVKRPDTHWQGEPPTRLRPERGDRSAKMNRRVASHVRMMLALGKSQGVQ